MIKKLEDKIFEEDETLQDFVDGKPFVSFVFFLIILLYMCYNYGDTRL